MSDTFQRGPLRVSLLDPKEQSRGGRLMPNISVWPNAAAVSLLSHVLEGGATQSRYFLSGKACAGILRRADKRRRTLPEPLKRALEEVVARELTPEPAVSMSANP